MVVGVANLMVAVVAVNLLAVAVVAENLMGEEVVEYLMRVAVVAVVFVRVAGEVAVLRNMKLIYSCRGVGRRSFLTHNDPFL